MRGPAVTGSSRDRDRPSDQAVSTCGAALCAAIARRRRRARVLSLQLRDDEVARASLLINRAIKVVV
jgi:hypothetical protein